MAGRRTNLALAVLLAAALATGGLAYGVGTGWNAWVVVVHGVVGLAIVALAPWKSVIARRGLRRERTGRTTSVLLSVLVAVALAFGVAHAAGAHTLGPVTSMQLHVGAALVAVPFAAWHVVARRIRPRRMDASRRNLLRAGVLLGGAGIGWVAIEGVLRVTGAPGADRRFTGSHEAGTDDPARMPVTQWLDDPVPAVDADAWRLRAAGRTWSYDELRAFDDQVRATIDCTGGWYATQDWEGVRLDRLLDDPGDARSVVVRSATGYARRFPARDLDRLWLATRVGGRPLSPGHGFPARIVAPGRRGFWWVKWVEAIDLDDTPWWWQPPFPLT